MACASRRRGETAIGRRTDLLNINITSEVPEILEARRFAQCRSRPALLLEESRDLSERCLVEVEAVLPVDNVTGRRTQGSQTVF